MERGAEKGCGSHYLSSPVGAAESGVLQPLDHLEASIGELDRAVAEQA